MRRIAIGPSHSLRGGIGEGCGGDPGEKIGRVFAQPGIRVLHGSHRKGQDSVRPHGGVVTHFEEFERHELALVLIGGEERLGKGG